MASHIKKSVQLSALCIAIACVHTQALAFENLEQLDDEMLAESTGEGIAFLPENFSIRMNGIDDTPDTGYIRFIPVGPIQGKDLTGTKDVMYNTIVNLSTGCELSGTCTSDKIYDSFGTEIQKADIYLYGLGISQSNQDYGVNRNASHWDMSFGRPITSWGSADNPWIYKTVTEKINQFTSKNNGAGDDLTYLSLEAPLYHKSIDSSVDKSQYNLRLQLWADAFMRDANVAEGVTTATVYDGLSEQLRLTMVWDGLSINGSTLKLFQTQAGVTGSTSLVTKNLEAGLNKAYNQTFGMAATLRLNSGPTDTMRASTIETSRKNEWVSYDASKIAYAKDYFTDAQKAEFASGNFSNMNGLTGANYGNNSIALGRPNQDPTFNGTPVKQNQIVIADGTGTAPSGTILWNGAEAYRGGSLANANPTNPNKQHVISSYVPIGNSQGNNIIDDNYSDGPRYVWIDGVQTPVSWRVYWNYVGTGFLASVVGVKSDPVFLRAICGAANGAPGSSSHGSTIGLGDHCFNMEGFRIISAEVSAKNDWKLPDAAKKSIVRINAETMINNSGDYAVNTPALSGGNPTFDDPSKGIFLYGLNANMVLGTLYQPLIFDADGQNFSIEITRVPNDYNVYKNIYTKYDIDSSNSTAYFGSTCNVYQCGNNDTANYQGTNATHSSITIGSTVYDPITNQLKAYKGIESFGISFGELKDESGLSSVGRRDYVQTFNTTRTTKTVREREYVLQYEDRWLTDNDYRWNEVVTDGYNWNGVPNAINIGSINGVNYQMGCNTGWGTSPRPTCSGTAPPTNTNWAMVKNNGSTVGNKAYYYNTSSSWTNPWVPTNQTNRTQNTNYQILGLKNGCINNCGAGGVGHALPTTGFPTDLTSAATVGNNLGSVVIDGMLIQHMKITTTGLK